jgi:minichromosome maintenance protein 10
LPLRTSQSQHGTAKKPKLSFSPPKKDPLKPSKLLDNLVKMKPGDGTKGEDVGWKRATGFGERQAGKGGVSKALSREKASTPSAAAGCTEPVPASTLSAPPPTRRDDRLVLIEALQRCSSETNPAPPLNDPDFQKIEPYSGIHLSYVFSLRFVTPCLHPFVHRKRLLSHETLSSHLVGRYYLSPSLLYSVIRPLPSNQGYDIPVEGDWVTIAVIAERGEIKFTNAGQVPNNDDDDDDRDKAKLWQKGKNKGKGKDAGEKGRKKYMSMKLVDFGSKVKGKGDALLTMLLFEADDVGVEGSEGSEQKKRKGKGEEKVYKGGSGGAFEACMKLHEGAVIAVLNPRILKPYQVSHRTQRLVHT